MTAEDDCIRLVLVNVSSMFIDLLRHALASEKAIQIAACAATPSELQQIIRESTLDVAIVGVGGITALPFLELTTDLAPSVRQIVISPNMAKEDVVSFFRRGARGLVCAMQTDLSALLKCIRCVRNGQTWANAAQLEQLICSLSIPRSLTITNVVGDTLLSKREEQVLCLLADGLTNRELAKVLKLSEHTVKNHLFRIFDKLGVSSRMEAVLYAMSQRQQKVGLRASTHELRAAPRLLERTDGDHTLSA